MSREVLDTRGLRCPVPANRTRDRLKTMPAGAELDVLGDDPLFALDVRAMVEREGHVVVRQRDAVGGGLALLVRKSG